MLTKESDSQGAINQVPTADNEYSQPRSGIFCHPERSEGSLSMGTEMLRFAQHDRTDLE
jgi:hypothetical protein